MATPKQLIYSPESIDELDAIWQWNVRRYGPQHADAYLAFLLARKRDHLEGSRVSARPDLRYVLIRRRAASHGHVAVYCFDDSVVEVLHVFHTAQDWQGILATEANPDQ